MSDTPYRPIACGLHESYQYAVIKAAELVLRWEDEAGVQHQAQITPLDVVTKERAEFLIFREKSGQTREVRLDRIQYAAECSTGKVLAK